MSEDSTWGMRGRSGKVARLITNETCNQGCAFCHRRQPQERREFVALAAVRARARAADGDVLVITGGEPTLRRDLASIVSLCAEGPARSVELETNATLLNVERAAALKRSGLDLARVHLPAWGEDADALTRDPGGFELARAGIESIVAAGLRLEISAPVVATNRETLPTLPERLAETGWPVEALVLNVPQESPNSVLLCTAHDAAQVIQSTDVAARRAGVSLRLDTSTPIAPCLFDRPARVAHLFALSPGGSIREGYERRKACEPCMLADRCPGLPKDDPSTPTPIRQDRVRRRLSVISSIPDQIDRELYQDEIQRPVGHAARRARTIRVAFACNQACDFCFVSTHLPSAQDEAIRSAIVEAAERGDDINLSGGEPTLLPNLEDWIALARDKGAGTIEIQTNATRIDMARARSLKDAGADLLFVSLHGSCAEISDVVTKAPGTFDDTIAGLDAASACELRLRVNFVFCETNYPDFPAFVELLTTRYPHAELCVSFVAPSTDMVPRTKDLIPRYSDIQPSLAEGLRIARARGTRVSGFDAMCGLPLCLTPSEVLDVSALADAPDAYDGGEMVRGKACAECSAQSKCFGLRQGYAEVHGTDELTPL
ncbi:MAG: molybdenum cofactor biosynthesis enzyme MoaA [Polyangiales bacterium]|jgi:molybdenum cofactor biosynthesis enzyme MoaA